jgi:hypothetical protein
MSNGGIHPMNTVPVSFRAELPGTGWIEGSREAAEQVGAALLLLHDESGRFTSNITVTGELHEDTTDLAALADAAVESLTATSTSVTVLERDSMGTPEAPGLMQMLEIVVPHEGEDLLLRQCQVFIAARDSSGDAAAMLVYLLSLTAEKDVLGSLAGEFQAFVASFELVPSGPEAGGGQQ